MARPVKMGHLALSGTPRYHSPMLSFVALEANLGLERYWLILPPPKLRRVPCATS